MLSFKDNICPTLGLGQCGKIIFLKINNVNQKKKFSNLEGRENRAHRIRLGINLLGKSNTSRDRTTQEH
jgi:hypothetical protein